MFYARAVISAKGIGIDEITAIAVEANGTATVLGSGGTTYTLTAENGVLTSTQAGGGIY